MTRSELLAVAKPILFNTEMVTAIMDNRKTTTRRVVKPEPQKKNQYFRGFCTSSTDKKNIGCASFSESEFDGFDVDFIKPPFRPGDILYVRETWCALPVTPGNHMRMHDIFYYKADGDLRPESWHGNWKPSIHMPKEAARLFLRVTDVRVEQLQEISPIDCIREGVERTALENVGGEFVQGMFRDIWSTTIKPADLSRYGWDANPWVWVIEFERIEPA